MTMKTIFITGDRAVPAEVAIPVVALEMLKRKAPDVRFATGDNDGVESAVASVALFADIELEIVASPRGSDGKVDWDARHASLAADPDLRFLFLHGDHLASRIGASLMRVVDDRTDVPTLA